MSRETGTRPVPVAAGPDGAAGPAYRGGGASGGRPGRPGAGNWLSVVRTASGGVFRHKVQAVVIMAVLCISTASATLGLGLLNASNSPFNRAFAQQLGADAKVAANPAKATAAQLAATGHLAGVTALAGPFAATTVQLEFQGQPWGPNDLVGRSDPGGRVDDVDLTAGRTARASWCSTVHRRAARASAAP